MDYLETSKKAYDFLTSQSIGVIATLSPEKKPEAATVGFVVGVGWNIYIMTHANSRKAANIKARPSVAFVVGTELNPKTLQMEGTATLLDRESPYFPDALRLFQTTKATENPIFTGYKETDVIIRFEPTWARFLEFDRVSNAENYTVIYPESPQPPTHE